MTLMSDIPAVCLSAVCSSICLTQSARISLHVRTQSGLIVAQSGLLKLQSLSRSSIHQKKRLNSWKQQVMKIWRPIGVSHRRGELSKTHRPNWPFRHSRFEPKPKAKIEYLGLIVSLSVIPYIPINTSVNSRVMDDRVCIRFTWTPAHTPHIACNALSPIFPRCAMEDSHTPPQG